MSKKIGIAAWILVAALGVAGCGAGGPRTHPISGKLAVDGGDATALAGSHVEVAQAGEPSIRASGEIKPDGSFTLETLHSGAIRRGAREGTYRVRIVLNDDDPVGRRRANKVVARRFQSFDSSGLSIRVPDESNVTLRVGPR